jgi:hypothetical protein
MIANPRARRFAGLATVCAGLAVLVIWAGEVGAQTTQRSPFEERFDGQQRPVFSRPDAPAPIVPDQQQAPETERRGPAGAIRDLIVPPAEAADTAPRREPGGVVPQTEPAARPAVRATAPPQGIATRRIQRQAGARVQRQARRTGTALRTAIGGRRAATQAPSRRVVTVKQRSDTALRRPAGVRRAATQGIRRTVTQVRRMGARPPVHRTVAARRLPGARVAQRPPLRSGPPPARRGLIAQRAPAQPAGSGRDVSATGSLPQPPPAGASTRQLGGTLIGAAAGGAAGGFVGAIVGAIIGGLVTAPGMPLSPDGAFAESEPTGGGH